MATEVNKLCETCGSYYSEEQHDCPAVTPVKADAGLDDHPLFDTASTAEKLDAKVEEKLAEMTGFKATITPTPSTVNPMDTQVGGSHYKDMLIQPLEYSYANDIGPLEHTAIKYVSRWKRKGGLQDIQKAINVLQQLVELETKYKKVA